MRIALFATHLADPLSPQAAIATGQLLQRLGHAGHFPAGQTCRRQMPTKTGYFRPALPQVRHHVDVFDDVDCDVAVAPSGSCVGSVYHRYAMVAGRCGDEILARTTEALASRTYKGFQLLVEFLGIRDDRDH
ncbi:hypothetical protein [Mycobacterium sp.]|uniref:hypothetical protein n=1 Tax=Mycobacterium sp. TaxID=1785 RepID=UPI003F9BCF99